MMSVVRWRSARPFYIRVLRGEYELPVAFFVIGLGGLTALALLNITSELPDTVQDDDWLTWVKLLPPIARHLVTTVLLLVIVNCTWRSAARYEGDLIWSRLARMFILIGTIAVGMPSLLVLTDHLTSAATALHRLMRRRRG